MAQIHIFKGQKASTQPLKKSTIYFLTKQVGSMSLQKGEKYPPLADLLIVFLYSHFYVLVYNR